MIVAFGRTAAVLSVTPCKQLHTTHILQKRSTPAAHRGYWFPGKKKGGVDPPRQDVVDGKILPLREKLRYSYKGKEKYEYERRGEPKPNYGQFSSVDCPNIKYSPDIGYRLTIEEPMRVNHLDLERQHAYKERFGENALHQTWITMQNPYPTSFVTPLVWRFIEKLKTTRKGGVHNGFEIMVEAMEWVKLHQMSLQKQSPDKNIELDANKVIEQAVENIAPPINIKFVQVVKRADGFKPCPIPLTRDQSITYALTRLKKASLLRRRKAPVCPKKLATNIVDSYYKRGVVWDALQTDLALGFLYKDLYNRFSPVKKSQTAKQRFVRPQPHKDIPINCLPLENDEYGIAPGDPQWHDAELLDAEDK